MPFSLSVVIRLEPCGTLMMRSPLISIFTLPLGDRYFLAMSSIVTTSRMITRNTPILAKINCPIPYYYILRPEKHIIAMAMSPTVMNVMPSPCRGLGTSVYCIFSRIAPKSTMASVQPRPEPTA